MAVLYGRMDERYSRLERYAPLGGVLPRWQAATVAVVGCGGLGGGLVLHLARLGVGSGGRQATTPRLILVDRDTVGRENLGHQALFTEADAAAALPKAVAGAKAVTAVNSAVAVEACVASLDRHNIRELLGGVELIFDGLDSYATRFLLNDYALATGTPYLYAGVVRGELSARAIVPGVTGCLRCLLDSPPAPGDVPTCAAEGVFPPLLGAANLLQLEAANRILAGEFTVADDVLWSWRLVAGSAGGALHPGGWADRLPKALSLGGPRADCPACQGRYDYLDGLAGTAGARTCAPDRVELDLQMPALSLSRAEALLAASGRFELRRNAWCLTAEAEGRRYTVFAGGRLALSGSGDPLELERFAATYLGV
jgi:adenylyltransferase/sulfurtransferase